MPVVANGRVYVGTQSSVSVYGLFSSMTQAAAPTFSPGSGNYSGAVSVTISESSAGTTIYYTTDGSVPTTASSVYSGPIVLATNTTLSAMAAGAGFRTSPITVGNYVITGGAISFTQVASATPQSPTGTVSVSYPGAQTAGDLNVVVVGWNDTAATVQSVKDSGGNNYVLAIGPTSGTALRQSIYYLSNIVGGNNTVTVTFSQSAVAPDIRILEYRGVTAVDVTAGASGNSATSVVAWRQRRV